MNGSFVHATRVMNGATARLETVALLWMAERLPRAIHSDHLTALAALAMVAYFLVSLAVLLATYCLARFGCPFWASPRSRSSRWSSRF